MPGTATSTSPSTAFQTCSSSFTPMRAGYAGWAYRRSCPSPRPGSACRWRAAQTDRRMAGWRQLSALTSTAPRWPAPHQRDDVLAADGRPSRRSRSRSMRAPATRAPDAALDRPRHREMYGVVCCGLSEAKLKHLAARDRKPSRIRDVRRFVLLTEREGRAFSAPAADLKEGTTPGARHSTERE